MSSPNTITQSSQSSRGNAVAVAELERLRRTITVMFTDIKDSTAYFEKHGDVAGLMMVFQCNDALRQTVERHRGQVVKTIGDAIMATFERPDEAVQAAIEMQRALVESNAPKAEQDHVFIRIGMNHGSGIVRSNDVFGDVVNVASRVGNVALPEQIVISDSVNEQVARTGRFQISHLGRFALKGKEGDRDLFEVTWTASKSVRPAVEHIFAASPKAELVVRTEDDLANPRAPVVYREADGLRLLGGGTMPEILVVDDDEDITRVIKRVLSNSGYDVRVAKTGKDALDCVSEGTPEAIFLDIMMPDMSGIEVLERLRSSPASADIPVIFLTAKSKDEDMINGYESGADYYMTKPFTPNQLIYGVHLVLD